MLQLEQRCLIFLICLGYVMRSIQMIGVVLLAGASLVFCGDDGKKGGSESKYKLKLSGLGANVTAGTDITVTVKITHDDETVTEGDVASTELTLHIECGDHEVAKQEDKAADKGEVKFDAIMVEGDKFTGECTLTVSGKIAGEDVEKKSDFTVSDNALITIGDLDDGATIPNVAIVGRPFSFIVESTEKWVKVQPNELCGVKPGEKPKLLLIYYDTKTESWREVLTDGASIKPVKGVVSGLAAVKASSDVDVAQVCKDNKNADDPPSIEIDVSGDQRLELKLKKGLRLKIMEASDTPSLGNATLDDQGGKLKLSWTTLSGFEGGAELFFNNATEGNEWTQHDSVTWKDNGSVVSELDYEAPVKVLIKVEPTGSRKVSHWLYFSKDS